MEIINRLMPIIKAGLLTIFLAANWEIYAQRLTDLGISVSGSLYVILFIIVSSAIFTTAFSKPFIIRFLLSAILFAGSLMADTYQRVTANFLTYDAFLTLYNSRGFASEALAEFLPIIAKPVLLSLLLLIGLLLPFSSTRRPLLSWLNITTPIAVTVMLTGILFFRGGEGAKGLPSPFTPVAYLNLMIYEQLTTDYGDPKDIHIAPKGKSNKDIILIMDESVSAHYLDINSATGEKTFLKENSPGTLVFNYGVAAAATNCSHGTNLLVRYGGTREKYLEYIKTMPSVWEYAKKAGYKTVFLDAQRDSGAYQNGMTDQERQEIDDLIQYDNVPVMYRDMRIADSLIEYINNSTQEFIYVNKIGAHFPVNDRFPDEFIIHTPILNRGTQVGISDKPSREGYSRSDNHWRKYRNSYRNTLVWNTGNFFNKLITNADLSRSTIIYTADHGQDLHEYNHSAVSTHCNQNPIDEEGAVPLVIIEGGKTPSLQWTDHLEVNKNGSSHYNIFPTLLKLMSYQEAEVIPIYGTPLDRPTNDDFTFNTRFFARLGKKPVWRKIDVEKLLDVEKLQ